MSLASGGSLSSFINRRKVNKQHITDQEASLIIKQILLGLNNIHRHLVIHRDITPKNILIDFSEKMIVKIADFGLGVEIQGFNEHALTIKCGTALYMPI